jgi:hypothetical protein
MQYLHKPAIVKAKTVRSKEFSGYRERGDFYGYMPNH